jgi:uroporphyrinogen decarboxylase
MMEGGSASQPARTLDLYRSDRSTFHVLLEKLTVAVSSYLKMQAACGVDALQIFDSHGGLLPPEDFQEASGRWMKEAVSEVRRQNAEGRVSEAKDGRQDSPAVIVFSLGTHQSWPDLIGTGADVLGVDWQSSLASVREVVPEGIALQGNLPPALLAEASPETVTSETRRVLDEMRGRNGHIFNLGHGTPPAARLENIGALMATVREFRS